MKISIVDSNPTLQIEDRVNYIITVSDNVPGYGTMLLSTIDAEGDLVVGLEADVITCLPIGADTYLLTVDTGVVRKMKWIARSPAIVGPGAKQYQIVVTGATPFTPVFSGFLLDGTDGGKTVLAVSDGKTLTLTAADDYDVEFPRGGTAAMLTGPNAFTGDIGFFGTAAVAQQTELTDELTTITHSAPGTPDYAIADLVQNTGFGFVSLDEGLTVLSVIENLQTRVNELETKLAAYGLLVDAD